MHSLWYDHCVALNNISHKLSTSKQPCMKTRFIVMVPSLIWALVVMPSFQYFAWPSSIWRQHGSQFNQEGVWTVPQ